MVTFRHQRESSTGGSGLYNCRGVAGAGNHATMQHTGLAFLNMELNVMAPVIAGDTIHVECEVIEARMTSKRTRGLVRTRNKIVNQRGETVIEYTPLRMIECRDAD